MRRQMEEKRLQNLKLKEESRVAREVSHVSASIFHVCLIGCSLPFVMNALSFHEYYMYP